MRVAWNDSNDAGPNCAVMCNLINIHTYIHTEVFVISIIDPPLGGSMRVA